MKTRDYTGQNDAKIISHAFIIQQYQNDIYKQANRLLDLVTEPLLKASLMSKNDPAHTIVIVNREIRKLILAKVVSKKTLKVVNKFYPNYLTELHIKKTFFGNYKEMK